MKDFFGVNALGVAFCLPDACTRSGYCVRHRRDTCHSFDRFLIVKDSQYERERDPGRLDACRVVGLLHGSNGVLLIVDMKMLP